MARTLLETHRHPKFPRLTLDRRVRSRFYQARTYLDGKLRQWSTKTDHLPTAFKLGEDWYRRQVRASVAFGRQHPVAKLTNNPTVAEVFKSYHADLPKPKQPEAMKRWGPIADFWRVRLASDVTTATFKEFYRWRKKVGTSTRHKDVVLIRQVLKYAVEEGHITSLPLIPKTGSIAANPRPWLTHTEWKHLVKVSEKRLNAPWKVMRQRHDMHDQMLFMVSTMCRVGEMLALRFRDCRVENGVLIANVIGKRGHRTIIGSREAALIVQRRKADDDGALVFTEHHRDAFRELLIEADLYKDSTGFTRNFKSLRATAISFRVLAGTNLLLIARNAGTSLAMIDQFYAKRLSAEMGKEVLSPSLLFGE